MKNVLLEALTDSLKILAVLAIINFLIAIFEKKISTALEHGKKWTPLIGVTFALLPQCGFSVAATDLYHKRRITMGTLIGIYLATSDEALPILISNPDKIIMILPLLGIKFFVGILTGYAVDFFISKLYKQDTSQSENIQSIDYDHHHDCCHGKICNKNDKFTQYFLHPVIHSLKIFAYILAINIIFGILIYSIGEDKIMDFMLTNRYIAPFYAVLVGLIPNCASSVILTELYIMGGIGFGAVVGGLCINSGVGLMMLFKDKKSIKNNLIILSILLTVSLLVGYVTSFICNFK